MNAKSIEKRLSYLKNNIQGSVSTSLNHIRRNDVILVGAWMGTKFADNSRYLYQYLFQNRKKLGLKKVIWVTGNSKVNKELNNLGYKSCVIGSEESNYWHSRAGVHIICNQMDAIPGFIPDIDTKLSFGAKKVNLWQGVGGIKAVGNASNDNKASAAARGSIYSAVLNSSFYKYWMSPGGWSNQYVLATGKGPSKAMLAYMGCSPDRIFISGYPRNCECLKYLPEEEAFIEKLKSYFGSILYLPTFRSDDSAYIHPLKDERIRSFLKEKNILWIEKPHTADVKGDAVVAEDTNICNLDPSFDINTIYDKVSCVMTDYSSVAFDAVYHRKPLIMYCPDIDKFRHGDVGFLIDFEGYFRDELCEELDSTYLLIQNIFEDPDTFLTERKDSYWKINEYAFDNKSYTYEEIWRDICALK